MVVISHHLALKSLSLAIGSWWYLATAHTQFWGPPEKKKKPAWFLDDLDEGLCCGDDVLRCEPFWTFGRVDVMRIYDNHD